MNKKPDKKNSADNGITKGTIVGIRLVDGSKYIGKFVKANVDYVWLETKDSHKPLDIPRIIIRGMLVLLDGGK